MIPLKKTKKTSILVTKTRYFGKITLPQSADQYSESHIITPLYSFRGYEYVGIYTYQQNKINKSTSVRTKRNMCPLA